MVLKKAVQTLLDDININDLTMHAKKFGRGRFKEETNLNVYLKRDTQEKQLLNIKIYYGLKPYYRPWVEFSNITNIIKLGKTIKYFDSIIEDNLLKLFSNYLRSGEKIYVEYNNDIETSFGLTYDFPPPITRLGYKLFNLGFTWFKDWYFPEGGYEGGQKLQGEKPLNEKSKYKHLKNISFDVQTFLNEIEKYNKNKEYVIRAKKRGENILKRRNIGK